MTPLLVVVAVLFSLRARRPPNSGRPDESVMSAARGLDAAGDAAACLGGSAAGSASGSVRLVLVRRRALSPNSGLPLSSVGPTP